MRRVILVVVALAAARAQADLPRGEWRTARAIVLPHLAGAGLVYLVLDDEALAGVKSLSEYRIVRDGRTEVPYRMIEETGRAETHDLPVKVLARGRLEEKQAQITFDLGTGGVPANRIVLSLTGDNFRCKAQVEGSRDGQQWWSLGGPSIVYRHEGRFEKTRVNLPANEYRFLRVTLSRLEGKLPGIEGASAYCQVTVQRRLVQVPVTLSRRERRRERRTLLCLNAGKTTRDLAEAKFEVAEPTFDRQMSIEYFARKGVSQPGYDYGYGASATLRRLTAGKAVVVPLESGGVQRVCFSIYNGDDRPLTIEKVTLYRVRRGLAFSADPARKYALWYGRPGAPEPSYEIQRLPMAREAASLSLASLGPARKLPLKPPPPPPWSEQHRALFWVILVGVIVLLAVIIVRAMRSAGDAGAGK